MEEAFLVQLEGEMIAIRRINIESFASRALYSDLVRQKLNVAWNLSMRMMLLGFVIPGVLAGMLASVLAVRLRTRFPDAYRAAGSPSSRVWHPFWVVRFVSKGVFRRLDALSSAIALISCGLLVFSFFMGALVLCQELL